MYVAHLSPSLLLFYYPLTSLSIALMPLTELLQNASVLTLDGRGGLHRMIATKLFGPGVRHEHDNEKHEPDG